MRSLRTFAANIAAVFGVSLFAIGCGASTTTATTTTQATSGAATLVGVDAFAAKITAPGVVSINVHVPNEGNIASTDLAIPYTEIATSKQLPKDHATPLAVYCRSGSMSAEAVVDLKRLGYTNITELDGGYNAWKAAGQTLTPK